MKPIYLSLCLLLSPAQAGLKKSDNKTQETVQEKLSLDQLKQGSANDGGVVIDVVGKLQAGDLVTFLLPNNKRVVGRVTKSTLVEDRRIQIVGIFLGENEAGFGFVFDKSGQVGGTLFFKGTKEIYRLRYDDLKQRFYFMKDIYKDDDSM